MLMQKFMNDSKPFKQIVDQLNTIKKDPWSPPPKTRFVVTTKTVPKINDELEENAFMVQISESDTLVQLSPKSVKVKINNSNGQ